MINLMERGSLSATESEQLDSLLRHAQAGDHYSLLGVDPGAPAQKIRTAYYQLSKNWHPDRHFRRDLGEYGSKLDFIFIQITKAYKTLSDPESRRRHDRDTGISDGPKPSKKRAAEPAMDAPHPEPPDPEEMKKARARQHQRRTGRDKAVRAMRKQMRGRASRAKRYFEQGKTDYEAGNTIKAVSSLHLACQFDQKNKPYRSLYKRVQLEARQLQAESLIHAGASAEQFQNFREAIAHYQDAVALDPKDGLPYFRLARLVKRIEQDPRRALGYLREAVTKDPRNVDYRLELGELYLELGLGLNAKREFQAALKLDRGNPRAKAGLKNT
jgi:curved DNA-binding protein CbpA